MCKSPSRQIWQEAGKHPDREKGRQIQGARGVLPRSTPSSVSSQRAARDRQIAMQQPKYDYQTTRE